MDKEIVEKPIKMKKIIEKGSDEKLDNSDKKSSSKGELIRDEIKDEINDDVVIDFFHNKGYIVSWKCDGELLSEIYPLMADYIDNRFSDSGLENVAEVVYRIKNNVLEKPTCPCCGNKLPYHSGYKTYCSRKCRYSKSALNEWKRKHSETMMNRYGVKYTMQSEELRIKVKESNLDRYGVENVFQSEKIKEKIRMTNLERFGCEHAMQNEDVKKKMVETNRDVYYSGSEDAEKRKAERLEKTTETMMEHYGVEHAMQNEDNLEKARRTSRERYGADYYMLTDEFKERTERTIDEEYGGKENYYRMVYDKMRETQRANLKGNKGMTPIERETFEYLCGKFGGDDIEFDKVIDERYPYHVDFYVRSLDLFIEINAHWAHGLHAFDENDENDRLMAEEWMKKAETSKHYKSAVDVWLKRDLVKIRTARENGLNYLPIWSKKTKNVIDEIESWIDKYRR